MLLMKNKFTTFFIYIHCKGHYNIQFYGVENLCNIQFHGMENSYNMLKFRAFISAYTP